MSEQMFAEPGVTKQVHFDQDSAVDIYVSAESLRVYENPWFEGTSPNIHGPARHQHTVSVVNENSERRTRTRAGSVFQCASCLLLLAVILALIFLWVQMKNNKTNWRSEKEQLEAEVTQLRANNTELCKQIDCLWRKFCGTSMQYTFYIN